MRHIQKSGIYKLSEMKSQQEVIQYPMAISVPVCCIFLASVFASVVSQSTPHLLECRICRSALSIEDCRESQVCSHGEECYMDSILTPQLQVVFNGGCRSTMVCNAQAGHIGKRAVTDHIICSACCNTTKSATTMECNANLCGIKSVMLNHLNQCYYCGEDDDARQVAVTDPRGCRKIKFCADDEVCRTTTRNNAGVLTYHFGCERLLQCQLLTILSLQQQGINTGVDLQHLMETGGIIGRKRQLNICDICCGNGLCNDDTCESVRRRLFTFAKAGRLNYTTLTLM